MHKNNLLLQLGSGEYYSPLAFAVDSGTIMKEDQNDNTFIIEQLDEALEERQNPERRKNHQESPDIPQRDRRKLDRREAKNKSVAQ